MDAALTGTGTRAVWRATALAIVALGLLLRFQQIDQQLLGGDEFHAIRAARDHTLAQAFTYYGEAENSIPLTVWARVLMTTVGLTELRFRAIAVAAGLGLLAAPLALRRRLGRATALVTLGLIATTPLAVYYSLVIRPYAPAALLLLIALGAWHRWIARGGALAPVVFVVAGALSVFFHLLCLFPVGWLVTLTLVAVRRGRVRRASAARAIAGLLAAGLLLLGPGLPGLVHVRLLGSTRPDVGTPALVWEALVMVVGGRESIALTLLALAVIGGVRVVRRNALWGAALVGLFPAVVAGMLITQAYPSATAWSRYLFLAWTPVLMLAAQGAVLLTASLARGLANHSLAAVSGILFGALSIAAWTAIRLARETLVQRGLTWILACIVLSASIAALIDRRSRRSVEVRTAVCATPNRLRALSALLAALFAAGTVAWTPVPILRLGEWDSLRARRISTQVVSDEMRRFEIGSVPAILGDLAGAPDSGEVLLVWPYRVQTNLWRPLAAIQSVVHRRIVAVHERTMREMLEAGIRFENMTDLARAGEWAERGARYLVLLLDFVERPASADVAGDDTPRVLGGLPLPRSESSSFVKADYFATLGPILQRRYGEPVYRDGSVAIYDIRVRK